MDSIEVKQLIEQLQNKSSPKRPAAAKKLRKLQAKEAGPAVLAALKKELKDKRTWETQYQMIMALGESGYTESLNFLTQLAEQELEAMVYLAIGDAVTRLEIESNTPPTSLAKWINIDKKELVDGCLRSLAMLHIVPSDTCIQNIIEYASLPANKDIQFWTVAATSGWPIQLTEIFLDQAVNSAELEDTKKAAKAALNGKYLKWNPL